MSHTTTIICVTPLKKGESRHDVAQRVSLSDVLTENHCRTGKNENSVLPVTYFYNHITVHLEISLSLMIVFNAFYTQHVYLSTQLH